jgi:RND family efflux transporter MFP subunit
MPHTDNSFPRRKLAVGGFAVIGIMAFAVAEGLASRSRQADALRAWTEANATPVVSVVQPVPSANAANLELPGRLEAFNQAPIFARVSGYLKSWKADLGTPVKAGQLLAEIETPDLDQQLLQAQADLATAEADAALADSTAKRWQSLLATDSVAHQDVDEKRSAAKAKQAALKSARANLDRYAALKNFTRIVAPFDGVVTARNTDVGSLISVGASQGQELFVVSDTKNLRLYVAVPQSYAPQIAAGTRAVVKVPEKPDKEYVATVSATAGAVDAASGTTRIQLRVDNAAGDLLPGGYASVKLALSSNSAHLSVPASTLIIDGKGTHVATVGETGTVTMKPVRIARDLGKVVEIGSGLALDDRVIDSPPDGIASGESVNVAVPAPIKTAGR